ncbi:MAG: hypothetical protein ACTSQY_09240 [Candidatus Odinarchaeia archaeon]
MVKDKSKGRGGLLWVFIFTFAHSILWLVDILLDKVKKHRKIKKANNHNEG